MSSELRLQRRCASCSRPTPRWTDILMACHSNGQPARCGAGTRNKGRDISNLRRTRRPSTRKCAEMSSDLPAGTQALASRRMHVTAVLLQSKTDTATLTGDDEAMFRLSRVSQIIVAQWTCDLPPGCCKASSAPLLRPNRAWSKLKKIPAMRTALPMLWLWTCNWDWQWNWKLKLKLKTEIVHYWLMTKLQVSLSFNFSFQFSISVFNFSFNFSF